jgi:ubiquinone/menaquinone biosynthesis C-methylase UbiE
MRPHQLFITSILLVFTTALYSQDTCTLVTGKDSSFARWKQFVNLQPGDTVADIGSSAGWNLVRLASCNPQVLFYAEDIDSTVCNPQRFAAMIPRFHNAASMSQFRFTIGAETSTGFPAAFFKKVLVSTVVHEFSDRLPMLAELKRILRPCGSIYIEEIFFLKPAKKDKGCYRPFMQEDEFRQLLRQAGYAIVKETLLGSQRNRVKRAFECKVAE